MATAAAVADRFRELSGNTLTPLQLLKLAYIAHGWSFPIRKQGLIGERIEAWQYGPVIPSLYHSLKDFRAEPVTRPVPGSSISPLAVEEAALVDKIYEVYGKYSGGQLSAMTHRTGTPWDVAWQLGKNSRIDDGMISDHYNRLHEERNGERS
jgi:uncharacterized phage-associated protein